MSDYEYNSGVIRKVDLAGKTLEEFAATFYFGKTLPDYAETWTEVFLDDNYETHVLLYNELYEFVRRQSSSQVEHVNVTRVGEDTFRYSTLYYNGGACLADMLEIGIDELEDDDWYRSREENK